MDDLRVELELLCKNFRENPLPALFTARPLIAPDGTVNIATWKCQFPGKPGTLWEGSTCHCIIYILDGFPANPPRVYMTEHLYFHPNICLSSGFLDLTNSSSFSSIESILMSVQERITVPDFGSSDSSSNILNVDAVEYMKQHGRDAYDCRSRCSATAAGSPMDPALLSTEAKLAVQACYRCVLSNLMSKMKTAETAIGAANDSCLAIIKVKDTIGVNMIPAAKARTPTTLHHDFLVRDADMQELFNMLKAALPGTSSVMLSQLLSTWTSRMQRI